MPGDPFVHLLCLLASLLIEKIRKEKKMATLLHFLRGTPWSELKQCFYTGSIDRRRMGIKGVPCAVRCCCSLWDCEWKHISHNAIFTTNLLNASRVEYRTQDLADIRLAHYVGVVETQGWASSWKVTKLHPPLNTDYGFKEWCHSNTFPPPYTSNFQLVIADMWDEQ